LVDHADAAGEGVGRIDEPDRLVVEDHRAFVRPLEPLQDAHQRCLAGAVAADHAADRARRDRKIDRVVRNDRAEAARDAARADPDGWFHHAYRQSRRCGGCSYLLHQLG
jgi:hypothetical protein